MFLNTAFTNPRKQLCFFIISWSAGSHLLPCGGSPPGSSSLGRREEDEVGSLAQTRPLNHVKRNEVSPVIPRLSQPPGVLLIMAYTIRGGFTRKGCLLAAKTTFCLCIVKRLTVTLRCVVNVTTSSFQHFP